MVAGPGHKRRDGPMHLPKRNWSGSWSLNIPALRHSVAFAGYAATGACSALWRLQCHSSGATKTLVTDLPTDLGDSRRRSGGCILLGNGPHLASGPPLLSGDYFSPAATIGIPHPNSV